MNTHSLGSRLGRDESEMREKMRDVLDYVWESLKTHLDERFEAAHGSLKKPDAQKELAASYRLLKTEIEDVLTFEEYLHSEDCDTWSEHIDRMQKVFKKCYRSFLIEEDLPQEDDSISELNRNYFSRRDFEARRKLNQGYSPVTMVIRSLDNCNRHTMDPPTEPVTKVKSFGNYYTLTGVMIQSVYGYARLLEVWVEVEGIRRNWGT